MPNKRKDTKSRISIWTDEELKKQAQEILKERGLTLTDEITKLLIEIIKSDEKTKPKKTK